MGEQGGILDNTGEVEEQFSRLPMTLSSGIYKTELTAAFPASCIPHLGGINIAVPGVELHFLF